MVVRYGGFKYLAERYQYRTRITQYFDYDADQQLSRVRFSGGENLKVEYRYDILGRRTSKTLYKAANTNGVESETTTFFWHGMQMCAERRETSPSSQMRYIYHPESYDPLAGIHTTEAENGKRMDIWYYHTHLNGLPEELTNQEGEIVWRGEYHLWGRLKQQERIGRCPNEQNLRFQGQYFDAETGLHYNTFRYYAPECGRFTQQDPVGLVGGINPYRYAPNPLNWIDPLGLCKTKCELTAQRQEQLKKNSKEATSLKKMLLMLLRVNTG